VCAHALVTGDELQGGAILWTVSTLRDSGGSLFKEAMSWKPWQSRLDFHGEILDGDRQDASVGISSPAFRTGSLLPSAGGGEQPMWSHCLACCCRLDGMTRGLWGSPGRGSGPSTALCSRTVHDWILCVGVLSMSHLHLAPCLSDCLFHLRAHVGELRSCVFDIERGRFQKSGVRLQEANRPHFAGHFAGRRVVWIV
jgi:hypothetical protein